jgi:hypothetical protein
VPANEAHRVRPQQKVRTVLCGGYARSRPLAAQAVGKEQQLLVESGRHHARIKGTSARSINNLLGTAGALWQEESFDRIVRDQNEYDEKLQYMWNNPVKAGLVKVSHEYQYFLYPPE